MRLRRTGGARLLHRRSRHASPAVFAQLRSRRPADVVCAVGRVPVAALGRAETAGSWRSDRRRTRCAPDHDSRRWRRERGRGRRCCRGSRRWRRFGVAKKALKSIRQEIGRAGHSASVGHGPGERCDHAFIAKCRARLPPSVLSPGAPAPVLNRRRYRATSMSRCCHPRRYRRCHRRNRRKAVSPYRSS